MVTVWVQWLKWLWSCSCLKEKLWQEIEHTTKWEIFILQLARSNWDFCPLDGMSNEICVMFLTRNGRVLWKLQLEKRRCVSFVLMGNRGQSYWELLPHFLISLNGVSIGRSPGNPPEFSRASTSRANSTKGNYTKSTTT